MSNEPINPNENATPDPRIETQRERNEPTILTYDDALPVDRDDEGLVMSDKDTTRPMPSLQEDEANPTGDDHFFEMAPTETSAAEATQQIEEDFEAEEE
jgi:hypothetical protein